MVNQVEKKKSNKYQTKRDGSIFQRDDGRWVASLYLGTNIEGKKNIKKVDYDPHNT